jgi:hypothetical protein
VGESDPGIMKDLPHRGRRDPVAELDEVPNDVSSAISASVNSRRGVVGNCRR